MKNLFARFDSLNSRERLLLAVTFGVVILVLFFVLAIEPLMKSAAATEQKLKTLSQQLDTGKAELAFFNNALANDPSKPIRVEIETLERLDLSLTEQLKQKSVSLMSPQRMSTVLESLLQATQSVQLLSLRSLPIEPLDLTTLAQDKGSAVSGEDSEEAPPKVYRHPFEVRIQGSYNAVYDYLLQLESLSAAFFWDALEYKVNEYPNAEVILRVHTLSAEEGWLGG